MRVIDPGHYYMLNVLDATPTDPPIFGVELCFVKREGEGYPGNVGHHSGTTTQEVLRALIDRAKYVNNQIEDVANESVILHLRMAIWHLEERAARRHGRPFPVSNVNVEGIELLPTCAQCNHIGCRGECKVSVP